MSNNHGGVRRGAGPPRRNLRLSKPDAKNVHLYLRYRRALLNNPELTEEEIVGEWARQAWNEVVQSYEAAVEVAQEPYIL